MNSAQAHTTSAAFALNKGTPRTGEESVAVLSRGLLDTQNRLALYPDQYGQLLDVNGKRYGSRNLFEDFLNTDTADQISMLTSTNLVAAGTSLLVNHIYAPSGNKFAWAGIVGQTILPSIVATGLDIGGDQTDNDGAELWSHFSGADGRPFIVGSDPAFFFECKFIIGDVSGTDTLLCGFRRAEVNLATLASYADYAGVGFNTAADPAALKLISEINGSAPASYPVDTTQTLADATAITVRVNVSAAGVITYLINGAAPTVTAAATFDNGDPVIPFFHFLNSSDLANSVVIQSWKAGYQ